ncbi:MAG: hypothetical protein MUE78_07635 [Ilumatobacteraceae bacterium]|nr:hypothetical protein [Ilumatobacteraceae bacterium]
MAWSTLPTMPTRIIPRPKKANTNGEDSLMFRREALAKPSSSTIVAPRSGSRLKNANGKRSSTLVSRSSRSSPDPDHGRLWTSCWVIAERAASDTSASPVSTPSRTRWRRRNVTGDISENTPMAGRANTNVAGWLKTHPIQSPMPGAPPNVSTP